MDFLLSMRLRWLKKVLPLNDPWTTIADVGCGDGQFLAFLARRGYRNLVGVEPDRDRARNVKARITTLEHLAGIDLMFVWHVLEHVEHPLDFLQQCMTGLGPRGQLVVSVPNHDSIQTRLFGYYSAFPDYGRHLWFHNKAYVHWIGGKLLKDRNYEYEVFSWVDSIASWLTRRQNFIHKALKKGQGPIVPAVILALALIPLALILSPLSLRLAPSTLTFVVPRGLSWRRICEPRRQSSTEDRCPVE